MKTTTKRKLIATFIFSIITSATAIVHGVFFDLDKSQISRLSLGGFAATFVVIFISLMLLDWIFDIEDKEDYQKLKKRVERLERKKR